MSMWTTKRPRGRGSTSAWEVEERRERTRHAVWLVDHGAPMAVVAAECGVSYETLRKSMTDQIEREWACDADTSENVRLIVGGVVDEMELHCLGVEGMEDSPVARWARELRAALGRQCRDGESDSVADSPYDAIRPEDREAIAWVREHGGLDAVKKMADITLDVYQRLVDGSAGPEMLETDVDTIDAMMVEIDEAIIKRGKERTRAIDLLDESVPRVTYERHIIKRQRQIDESHAALRRRNARIAELETERDELRRQRSEAVSAQIASDAALYDLRREVRDLCEANGVEPGDDPLRAMGRHAENLTAVVENLRLLLNARAMPEGLSWPRWDDDRPITYDDAPGDAIGVFLALDGSCWATMAYVPDGNHEAGERVKRLDKVLDADGAEIRARDHVWHVETGQEYVVISICYEDGIVVIRAGDEVSEHEQYAPSQLTHRALVLAADGRPLREGETVYHVADGRACVVREVRDPDVQKAPECDREALLALADELEEDACWEVQTPGDTSGAWRLKDVCDRIREACGEADA